MSDYDLLLKLDGITGGIERLASATEKMACNTNPAAHHYPAVFPHPDGSYGVICYACSMDAGGAVAMCQLPEEQRDYHEKWPVGDLFPNVNDRALRVIEEVRKACSAVLLDTPSGDPRQFLAQQVIGIISGPDQA